MAKRDSSLLGARRGKVGSMSSGKVKLEGLQPEYCSRLKMRNKLYSHASEPA